jgi:hypothetical protein
VWGWDWVHLVLRPLFDLLYQPRMVDGNCGAIGRISNGRGNRSTRRKPVPAPLLPSQIPHDLTRARTRAAVVGSRRLTAWATARPVTVCKNHKFLVGSFCPTSNTHAGGSALFCYRRLLNLQYIRSYLPYLPVGSRMFSSTRRPDRLWGSTQPPIQWVPGALSPRIKRPGREPDHSPPTSVEVKKMWIYRSTPPYVFMV